MEYYLLAKRPDQGGLGIKNLDIQNQCMLRKWLFRLINEDGTRQRLLRRKYVKNSGDSHFWSGLMKSGEIPKVRDLQCQKWRECQVLGGYVARKLHSTEHISISVLHSLS